MAQPFKILESGDVFGPAPGQYRHTVLVWEEGDMELYFAISPVRIAKLGGMTRADFNAERITLASVFPPFVPDAHVRVEQACLDAGGLFVKRPSLVGFVGLRCAKENLRAMANIALEVEVCHKLVRASPPPTIANFRGCVVREGVVVALCFDKYVETLAERLARKASSLKKVSVMRGLRTAVDFLHDMGYCHNDINPKNVMFSSLDSGDPVLIDFDSCQRTGLKLLKGGTMGWCDTDMTTSLQQNDNAALVLIGSLLDEHLDGGDSSVA